MTARLTLLRQRHMLDFHVIIVEFVTLLFSIQDDFFITIRTHVNMEIRLVFNFSLFSLSLWSFLRKALLDLNNNFAFLLSLFRVRLSFPAFILGFTHDTLFNLLLIFFEFSSKYHILISRKPFYVDPYMKDDQMRIEQQSYNSKN